MYITHMILSILGLLAFIIAAMIKGENVKKNLFFVFSGSILIGTSYLFAAGGVNGAVSSYIGGVQAFCNFFFNNKNKKIPIWLILIYVLFFLVMNLAVIDSYVGILALLASISFVGSISAKNGKRYRVWQILNSCLWICYDLLSHSYGPLVTHCVLFVFTIIGILVNDLKSENNLEIIDNL